MINLKRKDSVADAVKSILTQEEIDVNDRTTDTLGGRKKTTQKDDVGPAADGKSTKVRFHAGPKNESVEEVSEMEKVLAPGNQGIVKTEMPEPRQSEDLKAKEARKKLGMKEAVSLKGFKERFEEHSIIDQMIAEVLSKDASAGKWISDFVHSDNPKFAGKSKAKRKEMALGAYYKKQNEETESVEEGVVDTIKKGVKKAVEVLGGPDDEGHKKDLQKKMGAKPEQQHGKPSMAKQNEEVEQIDELKKSTLGSYVKKAAKDTAVHGFAIGDSIANKKWSTGAKAGDMADKRIKGIAKATDRLTKEDTVEEGWDEMMADVKAKKGPQPSGGSGKKQGSRYGGGKQKDKPEHEEKKVSESKEEDVPFDPPYSKKKSDVVDKSGAHHTPMSKAKDLARTAMSRIKKDLGHKKAK